MAFVDALLWSYHTYTTNTHTIIAPVFIIQVININYTGHQYSLYSSTPLLLFIIQLDAGL